MSSETQFGHLLEPKDGSLSQFLVRIPRPTRRIVWQFVRKWNHCLAVCAQVCFRELRSAEPDPFRLFACRRRVHAPCSKAASGRTGPIACCPRLGEHCCAAIRNTHIEGVVFCRCGAHCDFVNRATDSPPNLRARPRRTKRPAPPPSGPANQLRGPRHAAWLARPGDRARCATLGAVTTTEAAQVQGTVGSAGVSMRTWAVAVLAACSMFAGSDLRNERGTAGDRTTARVRQRVRAAASHIKEG